MTPDRYDILIHQLGYTTGEQAAKAIGVDARSERRWLQGTLPIPDAVAMLLELAVTFGITLEHARALSCNDDSCKYIIRITGFADGSHCPINGQWVAAFDHEAEGGLGSGTFTARPREAMRFDTAALALAFWRKIPNCLTTRPDGKPNRPLTASHIELDRVDDNGDL